MSERGPTWYARQAAYTRDRGMFAMNGLYIACTGRLGGDPETKYTSTGKRQLVFSVAVDESTTATEDRDPDATLWLRCTAWEQLAEQLADQLAKGQAVYLEGRLRHGRWQTTTPGRPGPWDWSWDWSTRRPERLLPRRVGWESRASPPSAPWPAEPPPAG